jgi:hypothetical protein
VRRIDSIAGVTLAWVAVSAACSPAVPGAETSRPQSTVAVSRIDEDAAVAASPGADVEAPSTAQPSGSPELIVATPLEGAKPALAPSRPLLAGSAAEGTLALPTFGTATKGWLFLFGRSASGWVVRAYDKKGTKGYGPATWVAPAYADDLPPVVANDGDSAWFSVSSSKALPTRLVRIEIGEAGKPKLLKVSPRADGADATPRGMGAIRTIVALKPHLAVVGRDGDSLTFARMSRAGAFLDGTARTLTRAAASMSTTISRAPRGADEDDRLLLTWDADAVPGALETPGTLPAEAANPKTGIYVQRFFAGGEPASPARRLTRPSFEAHALDVAVELGACAVLASTPNGFEMFRFVRKGDDLLPYGGGLFLSAPTTDISLSTDVIGTVAITPTKLLRIGPGVKIVPSPIGFGPPTGATGSVFDTAQIASDGYGDHAIFQSKTAAGLVPTVARIDGEHMGSTLPAPWIGPPPQRLVYADYEGDEAMVLAVDGGALLLSRIGADGASKGPATQVPWDMAKLDELAWPNAPVPRTARAGGHWALGLKDGRVLIATGPKAGSTVSLGVPRGVSSGGTVALTSISGKPGKIRAFYVPRPERTEPLSTATIDLATGAIDDKWAPVDGTEHHFGALGGARWLAVRRRGGGLYLLANSGPKVSIAAQTFELVGVGGAGEMIDLPVYAPFSVQDMVLIPSFQGAAVIASLSGKGASARWLDLGGPWRQAAGYNAYRVAGDGPIARDPKTSAVLALPGVAAPPVELAGDVGAATTDRCPYVLPTGPRAALMVCEEGAGDSPLASRITLRTLSL